MIRYAITDGSYRSGDGARWSALGVNFVQLRDKTMAAGELVQLAREIRSELEESTQLLINSRADIAIVAGAAGVHLTAHPSELRPDQVRRIFASARRPPPIISISCHTLADVPRARDAEVDLILFAPVFEKSIAGELIHPGVGLGALRQACKTAGNIPVLALGGVNSENTASCLEAGAAGVAGIRLFA